MTREGSNPLVLAAAGAVAAALLLLGLPRLAAHAIVAPVHDRMPVILTHNTIAVWLSKDADAESLQQLVQSYPAKAGQQTQFYLEKLLIIFWNSKQTVISLKTMR